MTALAVETASAGGVWVPRDATNTVDGTLLTEGTSLVDADFVSTTAPEVGRAATPADGDLAPRLESATPKLDPVRLPSTRREALGQPGYRFELLQQWEGTVQEIGNDELTVHLRDLTDPSHPEEVSVLPFDEIPYDDRGLVELGAVLYWSIGYETTRSGQLKRVSSIRFRRGLPWTRREVDAVNARAEALMTLFGDASDEQRSASAG
jgi:hypothetical protein